MSVSSAPLRPCISGRAPLASAARLYELTSCAMANAARDRPFRKSPASASRGANAIACSSPSSAPHSAPSAANSASTSWSFVTSHGSTGTDPNSAAILTTRSLSSSLTYVKASVAPSRRQACATP